MTTHPLETYLHELRENRSAGVAETSYYGILANLLNEAGKSLKPKVKCIIHPKSKGAGIPDGGLFTPDQLPKNRPDDDWKGLLPMSSRSPTVHKSPSI